MSAAAGPDPIGMIITILCCVVGGMLITGGPLLFTPEAMTFLLAKFSKCLTVIKMDLAGNISIIRVKPFGKEGQYIEVGSKGLDSEIYVIPYTTNKALSKKFTWKGIRKPVFFAFEGHTIMVPATTQLAIQTVEDKDVLPPEIREWAETVHISIEEKKKISTTVPIDPSDPAQGSTTAEQTVKKQTTYTLFNMDTTMLKTYFESWDSQDEVNIMLDQAEQAGITKGAQLRSDLGGKAKGSNKLLWIILGAVGIGIIALIAIMALGGI